MGTTHKIVNIRLFIFKDPLIANHHVVLHVELNKVLRKV